MNTDRQTQETGTETRAERSRRLHREYMRRWRVLHRQEYNAYQRDWRREHAEKVLEYNRAYRRKKQAERTEPGELA